MITVVTTFRHFRLAEKNALESWLALDPSVQVIVFSENPLQQQYNLTRVQHITNFKTDEKGLPLLNSMFEQASALARFDNICYTNSDIIFRPTFLTKVSAVLRETSPYLAVTRRIDLVVNMEVNFSDPSSVHSMLDQTRRVGRLHLPYGSDVFIFPRGQYNEKNMPPLRVGRVAWDNWMIYDARSRFNKLIDLSEDNIDSVEVIHQDHPERYNDSPEYRVNYQYWQNLDPQTFILSYCNYRLKNGRVVHAPPAPYDNRQVDWEIKFYDQPAAMKLWHHVRMLANRMMHKLSRMV